ncbi:ADP-ribosylglycohydrolase family protein [Microbispora bryophytorum]|uniref:ADP-ribosylglycohydrolase family protein n=1 Tax=Microbispora bryophytorum subsp. camponoti TaxID=1677852 RepID=A0ABR8L4F1_9ACTN|nr:ADP-ribosylglycohydrolase family protein [Microbispora camponoti]MBD3144619.1 ADP-ribosylglycohydrolase family protein [Microbispora camponoti]
MISVRDRARGCLLGLAAGDALGAPAENLAPEEIAARWGVLTEIERGGTDDTEYTIFAATVLLRHGHALTSEDVARAWREEIVARLDGPMRGAGFSELGTVEALRRGLEPPLTGRWHAHGWSDGLAMRAAPYGIFAVGDPDEAARLVEADGRVSHTGEGIFGGRAVAAAVAVAMTGAPPGEVAGAALRAVPEDSWTARNLRAALDVVARTPRPLRGRALPDSFGRGLPDSFGRALRDTVVVRHYPWTDLAPEAVALAFAAYVAGDGEVEASVVTAANLGRDADTTAAVAGALAGAGRGEAAVPARWAERIGPVAGRCLPVVAGRDVRDVADEIVKGL